jgi:hypothetical protein
MLRPSPPKSNTQRQREFRERNPNYYRRLHAKRRSGHKAVREQVLADARALLLAERREPLMLPAPAETIEIPGMTMIPVMSTLSTMQAETVEQ